MLNGHISSNHGNFIRKSSNKSAWIKSGLTAALFCLFFSCLISIKANAEQSITDALGIPHSKYINILQEYSKPGNTFFIGTPYPSWYDDLQYNGIADFRSPNGDPWQGKARMQCTGFVWYVFKLAGAPEARIPHLRVISSAIYQHPYNRDGWYSWMINNNIEHYNFSTKRDMLSSGVLSYGDIIWCWDENAGGKRFASDYHHIGIYMGDGSSDLFWNSEGVGNHISSIHGLTSRTSYTVLKSGPRDQWIYQDGNWKYRSGSGTFYTNCWKLVNRQWYYLDSDGFMLTGLQKINGELFFFNSSGEMQVGWVWSNNSWYYMRHWGAAATNWYKVNGKWYLFDSNGKMLTGLQHVYGATYFMNSNGEMHTGWLYDNGAWYYFSPDGSRRTGWHKEGDTWYYLDINNNGAMAANDWRNIPGSGLYYFTSSGAMKTGWIWQNEKWMYLRKTGAAATGWEYINDNWYYFNSNGIMLTGLQDINGQIYYLNDNGDMRTGWVYCNDTWYYAQTWGAARGWHFIDGLWYYFDSDAKMLTGFREIDGYYYFMNENGDMRTGWIYNEGHWYFLRHWGPAAKGWIYDNNTWYFLNENCQMVTGTLVIGSVEHHFDHTGVWIGQTDVAKPENVDISLSTDDQGEKPITADTKQSDSENENTMSVSDTDETNDANTSILYQNENILPVAD